LGNYSRQTKRRVFLYGSVPDIRYTTERDEIHNVVVRFSITHIFELSGSFVRLRTLSRKILKIQDRFDRSRILAVFAMLPTDLVPATARCFSGRRAAMDDAAK
jgi:hypothetical protein